jgi:DNA (cytosine-5)-methyltransferase 1
MCHWSRSVQICLYLTTPIEVERLQGFPDDYTNIPWRGKTAPDNRRYKAMGNSMAVPVMRWLGQRIADLEGGIK